MTIAHRGCKAQSGKSSAQKFCVLFSLTVSDPVYLCVCIVHSIVSSLTIDYRKRRCFSAAVDNSSSSSDLAGESVLEADVGSSSSPACRPVYQSAMVDVYARFVMADIRHGSPPYMLHRKALFRLTDLLRDRIRLSDESVARLRGGTVVDGLKPGITEIQVCNNNNNNNKYTEDTRETEFLYQRLSMALQRGNAVSFQNTMITEWIVVAAIYFV